MTTARLMFALFAAAKAGTVEVPPQEDFQVTCDIGKSCPPGLATPALRGLCVAAADSATYCWDACNTKHAPLDYSVTDREGIALMVKQLRTGMRSGSCPGAKYTPTCNPSERCTPMGSTWGRGMCITMTGAGNQCLDMCDTKIPLATFHDMAGKQAGTVSIVEQVRAGRDPIGRTTCPGPSVWIWLWIPLLLCCCVGALGGSWYFYQYSRGMKKRANNRYREPEMEGMQQGDVDYDQQQPQDQMEYGMDQMPMSQDQMQMDAMPVSDDMPVMQPEPQMMAAAPMMAAPEPIQTYEAPQQNLFGDPGLLGGFKPTTVAAPMTVFPNMGQPLIQPTTSYPMTTSYPQAGSYAQAGSYPQAGSMSLQSRPVYAQSMTMQGGTMATQMPAYGAYGAYPGATTSMRIG